MLHEMKLQYGTDLVQKLQDTMTPEVVDKVFSLAATKSGKAKAAAKKLTNQLTTMRCAGEDGEDTVEEEILSE